MYTANMFLNMHVGFVVTYNLQKKVVLDGKKIARVYLTSGGLVLDILSVVPWVAQVPVDASASLALHVLADSLLNMLCTCNIGQPGARAKPKPLSSVAFYPCAAGQALRR